ncbi:universal stress protein [Pedobacter immunditicola]|uniref:universal stress protein n=1 Tax=Pedobacter immunditicola TaxID=3133440 RepID=UPI0030A33E32
MKNLLVAVDLTEMDETVIRYAHFLKNHLKLATVNFVHNIRIFDVDDSIKDLLGAKDIKTIIKKNLRSKISRLFKEDSTYTLDILEDENTEYSLKNYAEKNALSTIMLGFKQKDSGTAAMSQKLIRIFNGGIILVPAAATLRWNRILVPTDLSAPFQLIIKKLQLFKELEPQPEVRILKSFSIPTLYFPFIDDEKAIDQTHEHIEKQFAEVKKKYSINEAYTFIASYQDDQSVVDIIQKESKKFNADLIIMTAKGANKIATIFIGSTINELINTNPFQVIYILK